jgi:hypothetical protein
MQRVLSLIILVSLLASAQASQQSQPSPSTDKRAVLNPESMSPYLIEWLVDISGDVDLRQIWRLLKIEIPYDLPYKCSGDCSAETFDIKIDGEEQGRTVALMISFESKDFYQYLIFKRANADSSKEGWRLIGSINSSDPRDGPPQHRIESGDNQTWLVIRDLRGRKPSAAAYGEAWYEIKEREIKEVLSYPVQGHDTPCQKYLGRSYKSLLLRHGLENGLYTVPIQLLVSYNISECVKGIDPPSLFAKGQKAVYVWDKEKERFILDKTRSDVTESEMRSVYHTEELSPEKFIEYNFKELSDIAKSGNAAQKDWLRKFLVNVKDGPRKTALQRSLQ